MAGNRKILALAMGVFVPVAAIVWFYSRVMVSEPVSVGDRIPEFRLPTLEGGYASFSDTEERVLLVFLSSKCPSCLEEIACLDTLREVADSRSIRFIVIFDGDRKTTAALFDEEPVFCQIAYDGMRVSSDLGIHFKPAFLAIKKHRVLSQIEYGYMSKADILSFVSAY